jgi:hypothetical protein
MHTQDLSIITDDGGRSQAVAISSTSAQSTALDAEYAVVTLTTAGFVRQGANPTATSDGTDIFLLADVTYRLNIKRGNKLAIRTSGLTGTAYITPGA